MIQAHKMAGFISAHGIWSVSDGETLTPIYAYESEDGERFMDRLMNEMLEEAVSTGKQRLDENEEDANDAVFIFDGRIDLEEKKYDALIIEIRSYFSPSSKVTMAIPYTPATNEQSFKVHKPKILQWDDCEDFDLNDCITSFFDGVDSHEEAAKVWNKHIDESI